MRKIELKAKFNDIQLNLDKSATFSFRVAGKNNEQLDNLYQELKKVPPKANLSLTIDTEQKHRSLDANAYCWALCDEIAKRVESTKELIYQSIIMRIGVYEIIPIRNDAVESYINRWSKNGLGWVCQDLGASKLKGYTNIATYFGSSTYNPYEMKRLLDEVIVEAQDLGIDTRTPEEIAEMESLWGQNETKNK